MNEELEKLLKVQNELDARKLDKKCTGIITPYAKNAHVYKPPAGLTGQTQFV